MPTPKREKLIIHAGMHKTGSTSIQTALADTDMPGVHTLQLGKVNHSQACVLLFEDRPETYFGLRNLGLTAEEVARKRANKEARLAQQLEKRPEPVFVLSAERISSAPDAAVERLRDRFAPHFETIELYAYVRPPGRFLASMLQQHVKTGASRFKMSWPRYRDRFQRFDEIFGRENVHLRLFDESELHQHDAVADFAEWTGLPLKPDTAPRKNTSLSAAAFAMTYCYRRHRAPMPPSAAAARLDRFVIERLGELKGPKFVLSPRLIRSQIRRHSVDAEWMEERLGRPIPPPPPVSDDAVVVLESEDDLKLTAARFVHLLDMGDPADVPENADDAEALAWARLSAFIDTLPRPRRGVKSG